VAIWFYAIFLVLTNPDYSRVEVAAKEQRRISGEMGIDSLGSAHSLSFRRVLNRHQPLLDHSRYLYDSLFHPALHQYLEMACRGGARTWPQRRPQHIIFSIPEGSPHPSCHPVNRCRSLFHDAGEQSLRPAQELLFRS